MARAPKLAGLLALAIALCLAQATIAKRLTREVPPDGYRAQYGYVLCKADNVVHPTSTADVAQAIKTYSAQAAKEGKKLKIRSSRNLFHSTSTFPCPNQELAMMPPGVKGAEDVLSVAILHDKMNKVLSVNHAKHQMRVGPGMDMNRLFAAATEHKMSVQLMTLPFYAGLTLGGILATASHGTGDRVASTLVDMVESVTWVDAKGKVHTTTRADPEIFNMMNGGLGLMGIMTELNLQLTPPTNTHLRTVLNQPDHNMYEVIQELLKTTPHILIFWRPDMERFSAFLTSLAPENATADPDVSMNLLPDLSHHQAMAGPFKAWQKDVRDEDPMRGTMCWYPRPVSIVQSLTVHRAWAKRGGRFGEDVYDTVAPTNQMQATECDNNCLWNGPTFKGTAQDAEFAVEWDSFEPWINDVKKIFNEDLFRNGTRPERCQGAGYIWLRFGRGTEDYLSMSTGLKRPVYLQSTWLRSTEVWEYPLRYGYVPELIELMTLCKYNANLHFGKNWDRTFSHPKCPVRDRYAKFEELLKVQAKVDPEKVFEPALFTKIVNRESYKYYKGCATDYECFCDADEHCAPNFKCVPSFALPEFKVCKPPADWDPALVRQGARNSMAIQLTGSLVNTVAGATSRLGLDLVSIFSPGHKK